MLDLNSRLYQTSQIRELEALAYGQLQLQPGELMRRAGLAAFKCLQQRWPTAQKIWVLCGKGNNGGDGYVVARLAKQAGLRVCIRYIESLTNSSPLAKEMAKACQDLAIEIKPFNDNEKCDADVIVDALLGIGVKGDIKANYVAAIRWVNQQASAVLAIDVPSGVDAETGGLLGDAVKASVTVSFLAHKQGLFTGPALNQVGEMCLETLAIPCDAYAQLPMSAYLLNLTQLIEDFLPPRSRDIHKGSLGHVLVVGGNYGMAGAVRMAAEAAARTGAGLVTVATRPEHAVAISSVRPELICQPIQSAKDLKPILMKATVIVIGPGLGQDKWSQKLLATVLECSQPKLLDADALNLLATQPHHSADWVLTPHPGEAARLLKCSIADVQSNRFAAVKQLRQQYGGVCVLKGAGSLIADAQPIIAVCNRGNPGMATAGMGDVLSGIIGGLLAQKIPMSAAAQLGVMLHAQAGDNVANISGQRGLLALDLLPAVRNLMNRI